MKFLSICRFTKTPIINNKTFNLMSNLYLNRSKAYHCIYIFERINKSLII